MAIKTNTNKATANLFEYIASTITDEDIEPLDTSTATREDFAKAIVTYFEETYYNRDNRKNRMTRQDLFTEWAMGLPMGGVFDYYYNTSAVEIVGDILEETEEERNRYTEEQAANLLTYMIYRNAYKYGTK